MHLSPLRNSITSITTDLWRKICIVTKQNALFKEILNFLIDLRSVQINLHKGVDVSCNRLSESDMSELESSTSFNFRERWCWNILAMRIGLCLFY